MKKLFSFIALISLFFAVIFIVPQASASPPGQDHPVLYASADVQHADVSPSSTEMEAVKPLPANTIINSNESKVDTTLTKILDEIKTIPTKNNNGLFGVGWDWIKTVYLLIYLLIGMLYPTSKEWDFLLWPLKLLQKFIPNISSTGGTHVSTLWQDIKNLLNGL